MKNKRSKILAAVMSMALVAGCVSVSVYAIKDKNGNMTEAESTEAKTEAEGTTASTGNDLSKEETVYVIAGADGSVDKVIVSDWIKNGTQSAEIKDKTELKDIKNVKGDETFTMNEDNMCVWDAKGHDIYYQGTSTKALPVDVKVTYTLDGKTVSPSEIAGKSGKVVIRYDYTNNEVREMSVNGTPTKIYVPFAMLTGMVMDNEVFTNVEVTNGKLVNEGEKTIVTGIAFPGLSEDLGIDSGKISIPSYVEIKADAKNFKLSNAVTVATNSVFDKIDTAKLTEGDIKENFGKLTDAMGQLLDGSSKLYNGMNELLEKSGDLVTGIKALAAGAEQLKKGAEASDAGASKVKDAATAVKNGAAQLQGGLQQVDANSANLQAGAKQVFENLLASATAQLSGAGVTVPTTLTIENYEAVLTQVTAAVRAQAGDAAAAKVETAKASLDSYNRFYQGLLQYTGGVSQITAKSGELVSGATQLEAGATALKAGIAKLSDGAEQLYRGIMKIDENTPLLMEGVEQLKDGSMQLSEGLKLFNEEGVEKISELVNGELGDITARIKATVDAAKSYTSYAGLGEGMKGTTKFIYKTGEIKSN
ncbi:MAG: hypothetical protein E7241_02190 [Lachnospiraceae bacterium]|nr:hypothetical protein [Lachnospiraceae bacterium]